MSTFNRSSAISFDHGTSKYTVGFAGKFIETTVTSSSELAGDWIHTMRKLYGKEQTVVGLNVKRRPAIAQSKSTKSATLQLCIDDKCLILQLYCMGEIPWSVKSFLMDSRFIFAVTDAADIAKLNSEYGVYSPRYADMRELAKLRWRGLANNVGLKDLEKKALSLDMTEPGHVGLNNWELRVIGLEQTKYACIDAYVSSRIVHNLLFRKLTGYST